jgi:Flp pilus assembly protein CpaB
VDLAAYHQLKSEDVLEIRISRDRLPDSFAKNRSQLVGRYVVTSARRGRAISLNSLGPVLPADILSDRRLIALPATTADTGSGMLARGDRVDLLLSSTVAESPRNAVLRDVVVLDIKQLANQPGNLSVVYAVRRSDEPGLLAAGGTARVFILRAT